MPAFPPRKLQPGLIASHPEAELDQSAKGLADAGFRVCQVADNISDQLWPGAVICAASSECESTAYANFVEQRLRCVEIACVEALSKPGVDWCEEIAGFPVTVLVTP